MLRALKMLISAAGLGVALAATSAHALVQVDHAIVFGPRGSFIQSVGCYRLGETGYHWYGFCLGPSWLYPHRHRHHHHMTGIVRT
jgi:hypothetical protein